MATRSSLRGLVGGALFFGVAACADGEKIQLDSGLPVRASLTDADAVGEACGRADLRTTTTTVRFADDGAGCPFSVADNDAPNNGTVTARREEEVVLPLPDDAVLCGISLDFSPDGTPAADGLRYDDAFFLTFSDVVLVASDGALVAGLPRDGVVPIYDWQAVRGAPLAFSDVEPWCVGAAEGLSDCVVPQPETGGRMAVDFAQSLVNELSYQSLDRTPLRFGMVTMGDNDESDCTHDTLTFEVSTQWLRAG